jgi:DNA-binding response OmpR family regulator
MSPTHRFPEDFPDRQTPSAWGGAVRSTPMSSGDPIGYPFPSRSVDAGAPSATARHAGPSPSMNNPHLLLIDDDARLTRMVGDYLRTQGFDVDTAGTLAEGRMRLGAASYDALVLDLMLPDGDGLDFTRELRGQPATRRLPLMMLTARGEPTDRIVGLELGADDYLPKPFEPRELLARVKALLRRSSPEPVSEEVLRFGRLEIDLGAHEARLDGVRCDLTSHQFDLLVVLARSPGRVLSRDQIMDALKGHPLEAFDRSIDVHISRIRSVIEEDPKNPKRVLTVRGSGYLFARKQDA